MHAKSIHLCLTLYDLMDCSPPGSFVHGILQARILEWVAMFSTRINPAFLMSFALAGGFFTTSTTWERLALPVVMNPDIFVCMCGLGLGLGLGKDSA